LVSFEIWINTAASRPRGSDVDRHGKANANKNDLPRGVGMPTTMPITGPLRLSNGPPELRDWGGIDLNQAFQPLGAAASLEGAVKAGDDPGAQELYRPKGCRRRMPHRLRAWHWIPSTAGKTCAGGWLACKTAMSFSVGSRSPARRLGAIGEGDLDGVGVGDDVQAGENVAAIVDHHAAAQTPGNLIPRAGALRLDQHQRRLMAW